jgi:hypothetical protein
VNALRSHHRSRQFDGEAPRIRRPYSGLPSIDRCTLQKFAPERWPNACWPIVQVQHGREAFRLRIVRCGRHRSSRQLQQDVADRADACLHVHDFSRGIGDFQ